MNAPGSPFSIRLTPEGRRALIAAAILDLPEWRRRYVTAEKPGRILGPWIVRVALSAANVALKAAKKPTKKGRD